MEAIPAVPWQYAELMTAAIANNEAPVPPRRWAPRAVALNSSTISLISANRGHLSRKWGGRANSRRVSLPSSMMATVKKRASLPALFNKQEVG
jgi:hypothetical protein